MKNVLCSIIVPMFNESNNLENCLKSLNNQTDQQFEVIFIDDGSTDNTVNKLTTLLKNNAAFAYKILQQENKGAASAREKGITEASGEYICLMDCDDALSDDALEQAMHSFETHDADISMFQLHIEDANGIYHVFNFFDDNRSVFTGSECLNNSLGEWKTHGLSVCKKSVFLKSYTIYRENSSDDVNLLNNDEVITRLNFLNAKTVTINNGIYFYKHNSNSTTKRVNPNKHLILYNAILMHGIFKKNNNVYDNIDHELFKSLSDMVRFYISNHNKISNKEAWKNTFKITTKELFKKNVFWKLSFRNKTKFLKRLFKVFIIK